MIGIQTALLIAGVIVFIVVAAISYYRYHYRNRHREGVDDDGEYESILHTRREPRSFKLGTEPILDKGSSVRREPRFDVLKELEAESHQEPAVPVQAEEQMAEPPQRESGPPKPAPRQQSAPAQADGADLSDDNIPIELVARIPGSSPINRDTALGLYRQFEFEIKKPHRIFGLLHPQRKWCDMEEQPDSAQFTDFGVSVQLADRSGPITESELNRFSQMVLRFGEVFGRRFKFSVSLNDALEYAHKLDEFCKKFDAVAILNVVARNQNFRGSHIHQCAKEMGLQLNQRSIYEKRQPNVQGGELIYSLASLQNNGELPLSPGGEMFTTSGITLFMNIPRLTNPAQVFNDMVADAKEICKRLDGKLVDHNLRGMTQKGLKRISQQIRQIVHEMESGGVRPGSEKTLRLF